MSGDENYSVSKILPKGHYDPLRTLESNLQAAHRLQGEIEKLPEDERDDSEVSRRFRAAMHNLRQITITGDDLYDLYVRIRKNF